MIKTNLAVLMAQRGLKIADVHQATGISKTTLMALAENDGKGVQFDTVDKLCIFLGIPISDFFIYVPYIFNFKVLDNDEDCPVIYITVKHQGKDSVFRLYGFCKVPEDIKPFNPYTKVLNEGEFDYCLDYGLTDSYLIDLFNSLPVEFRIDFIKMLEGAMYEVVELYKTKYKTREGVFLKDTDSYVFCVYDYLGDPTDRFEHCIYKN